MTGPADKQAEKQAELKRASLTTEATRAGQVAESLFRSLKVVRIFESANRSSAKQAIEGLHNLINQSLETREVLELVVRADRIMFDGQTVYVAEPGLADDLLKDLFISGVRAFRFRRGVKKEDLGAFLGELAWVPPDPRKDDIAARLGDLDLGNVSFDIIDELVEITEARMKLPQEATDAIEAAAAALTGAARFRPSPERADDVEGTEGPLDVSAVAAAAESVEEAARKDEGLVATITRAGRIVLEALEAQTPVAAAEAAHVLTLAAIEQARGRQTPALLDLVATCRRLAAGTSAEAKRAAELVLAQLAPGELLEAALYEVIRAPKLPAKDFDELLARIAEKKPDALARVWLVLEAPDRQAKAKEKLLALAAKDAACLLPLFQGEFGPEAGRIAVDLAVEARGGTKKAEDVLRRIVQDAASVESAKVRAQVCLSLEASIQGLVEKLRAPDAETRKNALQEIERNGQGTEAARTGLEAYLGDRAWWKLGQEEMDACARVYAAVADLRAVKLLTEIAEGQKKMTALLSFGAGTGKEAAKKALAFLKEKRKGNVPIAATPSFARAFDAFEKTVHRGGVRRPKTPEEFRG